MNINDSFPSKYLKASDIPEEGQTVVIVRVDQEEVGKDKEVRPVLYFEGEEKGIILNKTNATNISKLYGYETEDWAGKKVVLGTAWVDFQGQSVEAIRIYPPKRQSPNAPLNNRQEQRKEDVPAGAREFAPLDDDIPF
jgi:arabinogalactan endo-1,4-beta-galactosidase